jgi:hypothetical protein
MIMERNHAMKSTHRLLSAMLLLGCLVAHSASAVTEAKLAADDAEAYDQFGNSAVGIWGDYAIVGQKYDDDMGSGSGSVYIFHRSGSAWTQEAKLTASDGATQDQFGYSVGISGDYAIMGAWCDDEAATDSGSAYVFHRNGTSWVQQYKLVPSDGAEQDRFGISAAICGDYAVVGAKYDDDKGFNSGSVYVFKREGTTWTQQAKLTASDGASSDYFGTAVAISGDVIISGAPGVGALGAYSGAAYVFRRSGTTWNQEARLFYGPSDGEFGVAVGISGDAAIVGSASGVSEDKGSASMFELDGTTWVHRVTYTGPVTSGADYFGHTVGISGNYAIIGARGDDGTSRYYGSAYLLSRTGVGWTLQEELQASDAASMDDFGYAVGIWEDAAIVSAPGNDDAGTCSGCAYVYSGFVVVLPPSISVTPASQAFGSIEVGATANRTFSVENTGGGTLSGSASVPAPFSVVSGGSYSLSAGASQTVTVRYSPTSAGTHNATVTFTGGGGATRAVSGSAYDPPAIAVTPTSHDFGSIEVGATANRTFSVENTGGGTLSGSASVPAPFSVVSGAVYSLSAGASQTVTVRYSPTSAGTHNATATFTGGGGASRAVSGNGQPLPPMITGVDMVAPGQIVLNWTSISGATYSVYGTSNLLEGFGPLHTDIPCDPPFNTLTTTCPHGAACYFYSIHGQ